MVLANKDYLTGEKSFSFSFFLANSMGHVEDSTSLDTKL